MSALLLEPGSYLVLDTSDDPGHDMSVWKHVANSDRDWITVGWTGRSTASRKGESYVTRWVPHHAGFTDRYEVQRISIMQRKALEIAAEHGVFYPVARRMWKELTGHGTEL